MADYVFKKNDKGIRSLLQSNECLKVMEQYAQGRGDDMRPFIGFDRAKVFVKENRK
jgi:hypothetical protein